MKRNLLPLAVLFGFTAGLVRISAAGEDWKLPPETARLKPGPGADLVTISCTLCHSVDYISTQPPLNRAQWKAAITKMQQKYGAPVAPDKVDSLLDYLVRHYGRTS